MASFSSLSEIGYIYLITSPSGKMYIGQTKQHYNHRWKQHKSNAICNKGCRLLKLAIQKYGYNNMKCEVLQTCPVICLNMWERLYIKRLNTLTPSGYNLTEGGDNNVVYSDESKKMISESHRKIKGYYELTKDLPPGIGIQAISGIPIGYRVHRVKGLKDAYFCNKNNTLEKNLKLALEYLNTGKRDNCIRYLNQPKLPKYIHYCENGYIVEKRYNGIRYSKRFCDTKISLNTRLNQAKLYLIDLEIKMSNEIQNKINKIAV
jgi:hypothetical protein